MNAVITAGGRVGGEFARIIGTDVKALAPFAGETLLDRAVRAVCDAGVNDVAIVGGDEVRAALRDSVRIVMEGTDGAQNLRRALFAWSEDEPLLYMTSDLPFVTGAALRSFMDVAAEGAFAMPLTQWATFDRRFPKAPPFGVTLAGERVVNGGAFVIPAGCASRLEPIAARFFDARKSLWRMARLTGVPLLLRFACGRLTVCELEAHAQRLLGIPATAVRCAAPELAYDVDTLAEYQYALTYS